MATPDRNIPDPPDEANPGMAAGSRPAGPSPIIRVDPRPGGAAVAAVAGRTDPIAGRSRPAAPQGTAVDSALEGLGALPSLLVPGGQASSGRHSKARTLIGVGSP